MKHDPDLVREVTAFCSEMAYGGVQLVLDLGARTIDNALHLRWGDVCIDVVREPYGRRHHVELSDDKGPPAWFRHASLGDALGSLRDALLALATGTKLDSAVRLISRLPSSDPDVSVVAYVDGKWVTTYRTWTGDREVAAYSDASLTGFLYAFFAPGRGALSSLF